MFSILHISKESFTTRLTINGKNVERISVTQLVGVWISEDLTWSRNCKEICKRAYSRLSMLTKLKYVGVSREDLLDTYILLIRSVTEYCAVVFHSSLTQEESRKLEQPENMPLSIRR